AVTIRPPRISTDIFASLRSLELSQVSQSKRGGPCSGFAIHSRTPVTAEDVLLALFEAINDRDLDRLELLHADDYELVDEATGEVFRGPAGARRNNEGWLHAFPDLRWEPTNSIARGDWACVE